MERKICSTRSMVSVTGCRPPVAAPRPGSDTSSRSEASRWASRSARIASMRALSCASMRCLTWLSALPALGLLSSGQRSQSLEQRGQCATLAQEGRLGICQPGLVGHGVKTGAGLFDQLLQIIHHCLRFLSRNMCRTAIGDRPKANGDRYSGTGSVRLSIPVGDPARCRIPLVFRPQDIRQCRSTAVPQAAAVPSVDLTCSTMALKAGLSLTASSARTLRSSAISAFSRPFMNTL